MCNLRFAAAICLTSAVLLAPHVVLDAEASTVVGAPATGSNCYPFGCSSSYYGGRYQELYQSSAFPGDLTITGLTFYESQGSIGSVGSGKFTIALSTDTGALTTDPNANLGSDNTTVFSGQLSAIQNGELNIAFSKAFTYDPSKGNLLLDVMSSSKNLAGLGFDFSDSPDLTRYYGGQSASVEHSGLVTGFDTGPLSGNPAPSGPSPVPLPASAPLFGAALLALGAAGYGTKRKAKAAA